MPVASKRDDGRSVRPYSDSWDPFGALADPSVLDALATSGVDRCLVELPGENPAQLAAELDELAPLVSG